MSISARPVIADPPNRPAGARPLLTAFVRAIKSDLLDGRRRQPPPRGGSRQQRQHDADATDPATPPGSRIDITV